jgi:hypothetical protein
LALIVEDGSGLPDADSYDSVANIGSYLAAYGDTAWALAALADQEVAARKATRYVDLRGQGRWEGSVRTIGQALAHPRIGLAVDGYAVASDVVHIWVRQATAIMASQALAGVDLWVNIAAGAGALTAKSIRVGPIEISSSFLGGGASVTTVFRLADDLLAPFMRAGLEIVRA